MYNILYRVINFKDYGNPSSRTRTLVIGVRKDLKEITPYELFPDKQPERTLRQVIGHLPSLKIMGEISKNDIYHSFRSYSPEMEAWIEDLKEGQSAFDNKDKSKVPHRVRDGVVVYNAQKNGDKYTRQCWDKVAPCIHTRNDILASQNTVHPSDNRVFSIRELMLMMSVPFTFNWSDIPYEKLNNMSLSEKKAFLKRESINIRQNLGEAVPTIIFKQIAAKISEILKRPTLSAVEVKEIIEKHCLTDHQNLIKYIRQNQCLSFSELSKISELANAQREHNAAYYTRQDICYAIIQGLPDAKKFSELNILEPSIGVGNFLPTLIQKYREVPTVNIDMVDIDLKSLEILKELLKKIYIPDNFHINFINEDFLLYDFHKRYDIVVGNPPYKKLIKEKTLLSRYRMNVYNQETNNIFSFFIEKAMNIGTIVALIVPKSLINAPEFDKTRARVSETSVMRIIDFGEKGFTGVKIETICLMINTQRKPSNTIVESYITNDTNQYAQAYLMDKKFPYWIIYRNHEFDDIANEMIFDVFRVYRDRVITKSITKSAGKIRVLKSRNIGDNRIIDIPGYDSYVDDTQGLGVARYLNEPNSILTPNLTYNPRACFMPKDCIADGSVAILTVKKLGCKITKQDLAFYATKQFAQFYTIARNKGTRSLNIDSNSVFFFGIRR